jgi:threonine dehydrogenase-like Zn-dependent dehydrogenase
LKATVNDLSSVTPVADTLLDEQGMPEIEVSEWDVLDSVFVAEHASEAILNISESINPGGRIFILGHIMDNSRVSPPEEVNRYLFNLNWDEQAGFYAEENLKKMLSNVGLDIRRDYLANGDRVMIVSKPRF